jgi:hypothetical protein
MDAEEVAIGWWPGDPCYPRAAFYAYAHPAAAALADTTLASPAARWDARLGEYLLDWEDVRSAADPHGTALAFARSAVQHACAVCGWDDALTASADGRRPRSSECFVDAGAKTKARLSVRCSRRRRTARGR